MTNFSAEVLVLNGPNLGRLGARTPEVYGSAGQTELLELLESEAKNLGLSVELRQTDAESELMQWLFEAVDHKRPVILNPAAFTHYSYALADAVVQLTEVGLPLIEVHISNPAAREAFRHNSVISPVATGTIAGFGLNSYVLALQAIAAIRDK